VVPYVIDVVAVGYRVDAAAADPSSVKFASRFARGIEVVAVAKTLKAMIISFIKPIQML